MQKELVSIITPTYNSVQFIADTIKSIQAQTYTNWELLITDDCSTDDTVAIVEEYMQKDNRITLFRFKENMGSGVARNNSIKEARGRYIALCDSDDRWYPEKLEKQLALMRDKDCAFCYSSYMTCNEEGTINGIIVCRNNENFATIKRDCKIGCLTAIYDTAKVGKVYMPHMRKRQDWGLMIKVMQKCEIAYGIKEPLAIYRKHSQSISADKKSLIKYNISLYHEILGWSNLRSSLFFGLVFMPTYIYKKLLIKLYNY